MIGNLYRARPGGLISNLIMHLRANICIPSQIHVMLTSTANSVKPRLANTYSHVEKSIGYELNSKKWAESGCKRAGSTYTDDIAKSRWKHRRRRISSVTFPHRATSLCWSDLLSVNLLNWQLILKQLSFWFWGQIYIVLFQDETFDYILLYGSCHRSLTSLRCAWFE